MNIIYMGTPDFAVEPLLRLIADGHRITLVVTQPDKEKGRGKALSISPVKECALKNNIPVFQPVKISKKEAVEYLKTFEADLFVVAAFGQILSEEILTMPKYGCINIHASLLPKLRGAAPIQWSILNGDAQTGVTIMQMDKGLDTGDILLKKSIAIENTDTGASLFDKLMYLGSDAVSEVIPLIESGNINRIKQDEAESTYAGKITKDMGLINFSEDTDKIERYIRGLNSWPSAYTYIDGKVLKVWKAYNADEDLRIDASEGEVIKITKDYIFVKTRSGALRIDELQLEGKKRMSVHDFLLGYEIKVGQRLGKN